MKFFRSIHAFLGFCLCLLMAMWFLSGFVMIYHSYPRVSRQMILEKQLAIQGTLASLQSLDSVLGEPESLKSLTLQMNLASPTFLIQDQSGERQISATHFDTVPSITSTSLDAIRHQWNAAKVLKTDTLYEVDQWTLPKKSASVFPIYKYFFDDDMQSQLYISSPTGKVLQYTSRSERVWAWLGAIPHWVYFTSLRENQMVWIEFVKWTSGISCIMLLVGMVLGIRVLYRSRKQSYHVPYRKRWYKWHYILGLVFGVISITFAFSGLMSLIDLPNWLKKKPSSEQASSIKTNRRALKSIKLSDYKLDYRLLVDIFENVKTIEWDMYKDSPYYRVSTDDETKLINASISEKLVPMRLSEQQITEDIQQMHPSSNYKLELISEHDNYYFSRHINRVPLPVYRVIISDELNTRYYYNPGTLSRQKYDDNTKLKRFLYNGLHSLHFKFLTDRPVLWNILMYLLLIGGSILSVSGIVLSFKWAFRKINKHISKINTKQR